MATAKKRVEAKRLQKVEVTMNVEDPQKSLDDLFNYAKRSTQYNRKTQGPFPYSFYHPKRTSSVGHSREPSSDDGFHSSSRQTLSPATGSSVVYNTCLHPRNGSAPALITQELPQQQQQQSSMSKLTPGSVHHGQSRSMNAIGATSTGKLTIGGGADFVPVSSCHSRVAKSCEFDQLQKDPMDVGFPVSQANPGFFMDNQQPQKPNFWSANQRELSKSLDAVTLSDPTYSQQQIFQQQMGGGSSANDPGDGLGVLPAGFEKAIDHSGEIYFIDHINKTTDWFDPRVPRHQQEERIRQRHAFSKSQNNNSLLPMVMPPQGFGSQSPHATMENVHRLQMERSNMQELQQQLSKEGLLESQQQSPQFVPSPIHPHGMYHQEQQFIHPMRTPNPMMNQAFHNRDISNDTTLDQDHSMEVDYASYPVHQQMNLQQQQAPQMPTIEPIMRNLDMSDLNPQEFDKYLRINDGHQRSTAKYPL